MLQKKITGLIGVWMLAMPLLFLQSCSTSSDTTDLIGNWVRKGDFDGVARSEAVSAELNGKVYAGLGFDGTNRLTDFWEFDPTATQWRRKKMFPGTARNAAVAFSAAGKVYVGLGYDGINKLKDFWEFDPAAGDSGTWKQVADFGGTARYGASAFTMNDKGYVVAGYDGNPSKEFWEYSPAGNSWLLMPVSPDKKRYNASVFVIDNKAYIVGGTNNGTNLNDFEMYDGTTGTWSLKRKITNVSDDTYDDDYTTIVRYSAVAFVLNGKGYLTTGTNGGYTVTTWEYNPSDDTWLEKTNFQGTAREGAIGFTVGGRGFVALGRSSSLRFDDVREFLPNAESDDTDDQ